MNPPPKRKLPRTSRINVTIHQPNFFILLAHRVKEIIVSNTGLLIASIFGLILIFPLIPLLIPIFEQIFKYLVTSLLDFITSLLSNLTELTMGILMQGMTIVSAILIIMVVVPVVVIIAYFYLLYRLVRFLLNRITFEKSYFIISSTYKIIRYLTIIGAIALGIFAAYIWFSIYGESFVFADPTLAISDLHWGDIPGFLAILLAAMTTRIAFLITVMGFIVMVFPPSFLLIIDYFEYIINKPKYGREEY